LHRYDHAVTVLAPVIDITRLLDRYLSGYRPTGVDRVTLAYIAHFGLRQGARALFRWRGLSGLMSVSQSRWWFEHLLRYDLGESNRAWRRLPLAVMSTWFRGDGRDAVLLMTAHQDVETKAWWHAVAWHRLRPVFVLHDLIPLTHPQFCRVEESGLHAQRLQRMQFGSGVVFNSHDTCAQWESWSQAQGLVRPPSATALLGVDASNTINLVANYPIQMRANRSKSLENANQSGPEGTQAYFVMLGTIEPRKNHAFILQLWRRWIDQAGAATPQLLIIGQSGWHSEALETSLLDETSWQGRVRWLRDVDDVQLHGLLHQARALLFPSHVEGFGLPMAEALAQGTPVIANDLGVFREVGAEVPEYISVSDEQAWLQILQQYATVDHPQRAQQLLRLQDWRMPTWAEHMQRVESWLTNMPMPDEPALLRLREVGWRCGVWHAQRLSWRKRRMLARWLRPWQESVTEAPPSALRFVWGVEATSPPRTSTAHSIRVEDGFIRSIGLGAELVQPISWVFDTRGLYFDATQPSDLEQILRERRYSEAELARAHALRERLVALNVTKYNLRSGARWQRPLGDKPVVLVAGQVESDASIALGCSTIRTNRALLEAVRTARPGAYIAYKPHPDVLAGLRAGQVDGKALVAQGLCDEIITDVGIDALYGQLDELHVMTSLAGFEALLRGVRVTCWGMPFYAGWGLVEAPMLTPEVAARRDRCLSLDELVAGCLIEYPSYRDPRNGQPWMPEQAVAWLAQASQVARTEPAWRRMVLSVLARLQGRF
jgi:glycosyltransferase involved in cell wall biosynthesis